VENSKVVRGVASNMKIEMRENRRCQGHDEHFRYLLELRDNIDGPYKPDAQRFPCKDPSVLPDIFVCFTNATRIKANALANRHEGVFYPKPERWTYPEPQDAWLYPGVPVIGVSGTKWSGVQCTVEAATPEDVALVAEDGERFTLDRDAFLQTMRLAFAQTTYGLQGATLKDQRVYVLDSFFPRFTNRHWLVAVSRVTDPANLEVLTPAQQRELLRSAGGG
jgi:hypothetical protein